MNKTENLRKSREEKEKLIEKLYLAGLSPIEIAIELNLNTGYVERRVCQIVKTINRENLERGLNMVPLKTYTPVRVVIRGKKYLDVTESLIDCGHYFSPVKGHC